MPATLTSRRLSAVRPLVVALVLALALCALALGAPALASTTGALRGTVVDAATGKPLAGATVTATSPSQVATTVSDGAGHFSFIALQPDSYTISAQEPGYDAVAEPGVNVLADQSGSVSLREEPRIRTIGKTATRGTGDLVRSGVTSDVYSIGPTEQGATAVLGGGDSLNQAYGAIASTPGVNLPSNQQGWDQQLYIRGGDYTQVAYEYDGLPIVRQSDLAPIGTLSSLGNQQVEVYTGGTPATSNSSGLSGYVNQVIKTGTYPGFSEVDLGIGGPTFYNHASFEAGGATKDRLFTYYVGASVTGQTYRYGDQFGGASDPLYFYPFALPSSNAVYNIDDGSCAIGAQPTCKAPTYGFQSQPGYSYEQVHNLESESVVNLHLAIPHKNSSLRDDVQLLYSQGSIADQIASSQDDIGFTPVRAASVGVPYPLPYLDQYVYTGKLLAAPNAGDVVTEPFPNSPAHGLDGTLPANYRDSNFNGYSIEKLQYQKNFEHSYLRAIVYGEESAWLIRGPNSPILPYGATPPNFAYTGHTQGANLIYADQVNAKNLITAEGSFQTQQLESYNAQSDSLETAGSLAPTGLGTILTNYATPNGLCYSYATGQQTSCFNAASQGGCVKAAPCYATTAASGINLTPGTAPAGSPAALAGARWIVTENGTAAQLNEVTPTFSSLALTDVYQPTARLVVNAGARVDRFAYATDDLESGYPARAFWFDAYNNEYCGAPGQAPVSRFDGSALGACPAGFAPFTQPGVGLTNTAGTTYVRDVVQPRVSATYTLDANTVLRGSFGIYAEAEGSNYYQFNTVQQDLPSFLGQFYQYGFHSPDHDISPSTSDNFDFSLEHHVAGTKLSLKLSPFYRDTSNQFQFQNINPEEGIYAGVNAGQQQSYGAELQLKYGDFARDGFSGILSYAHTSNQIRYQAVNGVSVVDPLNRQIELYNSYTSGCAGVTKSSPNWVACGSGEYAGNAVATFGPGNTVAGATVANPYYAAALQPLLSQSASYAPYSIIPGAFSGANGYNVPDVVSLVVNYRHKRFAVTPSFHYVDGANYGSPLVYPGYVPQSCTQAPSLTPATPGASCDGTLPNGSAVGAVFLPDPYTKRFDSFGSFMQPSESTLNLQLSYDVAPHATLVVQATNVVNVCHQRGYAWDNSETCQYSDLPSQNIGPSGNFIVDPPAELKYPYGTYFNCSGSGYSAVVQPFVLAVTLSLRNL